MLEDILRILGVAIVGFVLLIPSDEYLDNLSDTNTQVIVGMVVLATILFIDAIFGALIGLAVLIWYFKMNHRVLTIKSIAKKNTNSSSVDLLYGSPKNLEDAQTNVVNKNMMDKEMIGFESVYGEQVLGPQGLDKTLPGFDDSLETSLSPI